MKKDPTRTPAERKREAQRKYRVKNGPKIRDKAREYQRKRRALELALAEVNRNAEEDAARKAKKAEATRRSRAKIIANETPVEREVRLEKERATRRRSVANQSPATKAKRREQGRRRRRQKLKNETPAEREARLEYGRQYRAENPEKTFIQNQKYYQENPDKFVAYGEARKLRKRAEKGQKELEQADDELWRKFMDYMEEREEPDVYERQ